MVDSTNTHSFSDLLCFALVHFISRVSVCTDLSVFDFTLMYDHAIKKQFILIATICIAQWDRCLVIFGRRRFCVIGSLVGKLVDLVILPGQSSAPNLFIPTHRNTIHLSKCYICRLCIHGTWVSLYEMLADQIRSDLSGLYYVLLGLEHIHASIN